MSTKQRYCLRVLVGIISATAALPAAFALDITLPAETAAYNPASCRATGWCSRTA